MIKERSFYTVITEELNLQLYNRMSEEQEHYREWLLSQPPDEILRHCYEYTVREDILYSLEETDISAERARALLKSSSPLSDIYERHEKCESAHMEEIRDAIESRADDVIRTEKAKSSPGR